MDFCAPPLRDQGQTATRIGAANTWILDPKNRIYSAFIQIYSIHTRTHTHISDSNCTSNGLSSNGKIQLRTHHSRITDLVHLDMQQLCMQCISKMLFHVHLDLCECVMGMEVRGVVHGIRFAGSEFWYRGAQVSFWLCQRTEKRAKRATTANQIRTASDRLLVVKM